MLVAMMGFTSTSQDTGEIYQLRSKSFLTVHSELDPSPLRSKTHTFVSSQSVRASQPLAVSQANTARC